MVCLSRAESAFDDSWGRNGARNLFYVAFQIIGIYLLFINAVNQLLMIL